MAETALFRDLLSFSPFSQNSLRQVPVRPALRARHETQTHGKILAFQPCSLSTFATMGRTLLGRDAMPKTVQQGKVQASLQNFFRPKAPPIFKSVVAAAPAALAEPEPVADLMLADCRGQWLLNLSADNDSTVIVESAAPSAIILTCFTCSSATCAMETLG